MIKAARYAWSLFHRLKIPFLLIFVFMNLTFLKRYGYDESPTFLLTAFALLNFSMHMFNNYFDLKEDQITGQADVLSSKRELFFLGSISILAALAMVVYFGFSALCFILLFMMMMLYSMPLWNNVRIKNYIFIKNITGSLFWWYLPFVMISSFHTDHGFLELFLANLFVLVTFMPFEPLWDIKDVDGDEAVGIKTIPNHYGIGATKVLVASCFGILALIKLSTLSLSVVTLFLPLIVFTLLLTKDTPKFAYQVMIMLLPAHIIVSLLIG